MFRTDINDYCIVFAKDLKSNDVIFLGKDAKRVQEYKQYRGAYSADFGEYGEIFLYDGYKSFYTYEYSPFIKLVGE